MSDAEFVASGGLRQARTPFWLRIAESWAAGCSAGQITLVSPEGNSTMFRGREPGPSATINFHNASAVWRSLTGGELGFGESYVAGSWSTPDLPALIEFALRNEERLSGQMLGAWLPRLLEGLRFRLQVNSRAGSRRNIAYHYDLGNDFYAAWLDETMTYSSALFASPELTLAEAQRAKYARIVEALGIRPGDRVLEIGCGWGGFAEFAAKEAGARVVALTISNEQANFARRRIAGNGLAESVEIRVEDYRDATGSFDSIVSIEMLEAVGAENWPVYFDVLRDRLKPGGRALLQVITVPDARYGAYRRRVDFIQRHIFPGGMLLSPSVVSTAVAASGLELAEARFFGADYAETLHRWNECFQSRWETIRALGFDDRFRRMWTYYLQSCEACFRSGAIDVGHFLIAKP